MQAFVYLVTGFASLLIISLKPIQGLGVFLFVLFTFPQYVTVKLGLVNFNTSRILILVLLLKIVFQSKLLRTFKSNYLDILAVLQFMTYSISLGVHTPFMKNLVGQGGMFFDTILPYFAIRLCLVTREDCFLFVKYLSRVAVPLAILAFYETNTGRNPYEIFYAYDSFGWAGYVHYIRYNFYRAFLGFGVPITLGLFFTGVVFLTFSLWNYPYWSKLKILTVFILAFVGVFSAMSSAPWLASFVGLGFVAGFPLRKYGTGIAIGLVILCTAIELYSNRHFWEVFSRFAMDSQNAAYRNDLVAEAFGGGMDNHWIFGYGNVGIHPDSDNREFHWVHKDLVNIFISRLARGGLFSLIPYLLFMYTYFYYLYAAIKSARYKPDIWFIWCLIAILVGWTAAFWTVDSFGLINTFHILLIGICGSLPGIIAYENQLLMQPATAPQSGHQFRNLRPLKVN